MDGPILKRLHQNQSGFISLPIVMGLVGLLLLVMHSTYKRAQDELAREYHKELMTDKFEVLSALRYAKVCEAVPKSCSAGQRLDLFDKQGREIVNRDGTHKISRWNVKVECLANKSNQYWVYVARLNGTEFLKDPLTGQLLQWKEISDLSSACGSALPNDTLFLRNDCYGGIEGGTTVPSSFAALCGKACLTKKYCSDNQVTFPQCPPGQRIVSRYLDRYGWGGVDLSKYTLCMKEPK